MSSPEHCAAVCCRMQTQLSEDHKMSSQTNRAANKHFSRADEVKTWLCKVDTGTLPAERSGCPSEFPDSLPERLAPPPWSAEPAGVRINQSIFAACP